MAHEAHDKAAQTGIVQGISYVASYPLRDILDAKAEEDEREGYPMGMVYQVYVRPDRQKTATNIRMAIDGGCRSVIHVSPDRRGISFDSIEQCSSVDGRLECR